MNDDQKILLKLFELADETNYRLDVILKNSALIHDILDKAGRSFMKNIPRLSIFTPERSVFYISANKIIPTTN